RFRALRGTWCWAGPRSRYPSSEWRRRPPLLSLSFRPASGVGRARVHRLVARRLGATLDVGRVAAAAVAGEGDPLRRRRYGPYSAPPRRPYDRACATGGADQGDVLPVGRDQRQRPGARYSLIPRRPTTSLHLQNRNVATPGRARTSWGDAG